jgi:Na+/H+ antiporter NhaC
MNTFLSETYNKPKLVESKLVKRIIDNQNNEISVETKISNTIKNNIMDFVIKNYKIIIIIFIIIIALYWRYKYAQNKKKQENIVSSESE